MCDSIYDRADVERQLAKLGERTFPERSPMDFTDPDEIREARRDEALQLVRQRRLRELADEFGIEVKLDGPWDNSAEEDLAAYLNGDEDIARWAKITVGGEYTYIVARADTRETAQTSAVENVSDDIYPESPLFVIDLDTGERFRPLWFTLRWAPVA